MSFVEHFLHLRLHEKNDGVILVWKCPQCGIDRDFNLIVSKGNLSFAGLGLGKPATLLDLRCSRCKFELPVDNSETDLLDQARQTTRAFKDGILGAESYMLKIRGIRARFVSDLLALTQTWKCQNCGQDSPFSFVSCWNCSSPRHS